MKIILATVLCLGISADLLIAYAHDPVPATIRFHVAKLKVDIELNQPELSPAFWQVSERALRHG